jgi:SAM-dependent methyltransferase
MRHQRTEFHLGAGKAAEIQAAYRSSDEEVFRILDLGCGSARYHEDMEQTFKQLGDKDVEVIGLDYDINNLLNGETGEKVYADATQETEERYLPFQDDSFDLVYSSHLYCQLEKMDDYEELVERVEAGAERVLKDSGTMFHEV